MAGKEPEEYKGIAKFFTYLSSPELQVKWHKPTGYVPITLAAYELAQEAGLLHEAPRLRHRRSRS